jgi:hypothetical protein
MEKDYTHSALYSLFIIFSLLIVILTHDDGKIQSKMKKMGNSVFRYFLLWMKQQMRNEAYQRITSLSKRRAQRQKQKMQQQQQQQQQQYSSSSKPQDVIINQGGWLSSVTTSFDDLWTSYFGDRGDTATNQESFSSASEPQESSHTKTTNSPTSPSHKSQIWELAMHEGDEAYLKWMEAHIWTYVGLSAPLLGAVNPLRSVISGENMGLPFTDDVARRLELSKLRKQYCRGRKKSTEQTKLSLTKPFSLLLIHAFVGFGCTNTVNPISSKMAFCDSYTNLTENPNIARPRTNLYCLDELVREIESHITTEEDPWASFPQLKTLLKERVDWDTDRPMITIVDETDTCLDTSNDNHNDDDEDDEKDASNKHSKKDKHHQENTATSSSTSASSPTCEIHLGPLDVQNGDLFREFNRIWNEEKEPMNVKRQQMEDSFWHSTIPNMLNMTWE